jgi:hypothetical protein
VIYKHPDEEYDTFVHGPWMDTALPMIERNLIFLKEWVLARRRARECPGKPNFIQAASDYEFHFNLYCYALGWPYWSGYDFVEYMSARPKERDAIAARQSRPATSWLPREATPPAPAP